MHSTWNNKERFIITNEDSRVLFPILIIFNVIEFCIDSHLTTKLEKIRILV